MELHEMNFHGQMPVEGYGPGFFRLGGEVFHGPLLLLPSGPEKWPVAGDYAPVLAHADEIDVLFIGVGPEIGLIDLELRRQLETAGLGVEVMSTPSACRTYNVLLAEGRRVAAALIPV